ncbi:MAG: calcium-binding protein [Hyphomonadaceae bacterium]
MAVSQFRGPYTFDPTSSSGALNFLALLSDPANYTVLTNTAGQWKIQLITPVQGVSIITFQPTSALFTPNAGNAPPSGVVSAILLSDATQFTTHYFNSFGGLGFSVADLIALPTRLGDGEDLFIGSTGNDEWHGGALDDEAAGDNGADILFGDGGNDILEGEGGNDTLNGGDGDDILAPGIGGNDIIAGGAGIDLVSYYDATGNITVSLALTGAQSTNTGGSDTLSGIEMVEGGDFNDRLTGDAADNVLAGGDGNDTLDGGGGADILIGGLGNDTYTLDNVGDIVIEATNAGFDRVIASFDYQLGAAVEYLTLTGTAVSGFGNALNNSITGNDAGNVLTGDGGHDTLEGFGGDDTLDGGDGDDQLVGHAGNDTIIGGAGDDEIIPGDGVNILDGGDGSDTLNYRGWSVGSGVGNATVYVDLTLNIATHGGVSDTIAGVENVWGSDGDDTLIGDAADNDLLGFEGNDNLEGLGGDDFLRASGGADTLYGGDGNDHLQGLDGDDIAWGGAGDDHILDSEGNDLVYGEDGDDLVVSTARDPGTPAQNNTLNGGAGFDTLQYNNTSGALTINLAAGTVTGVNGGVDTISGFEHFIAGDAADTMLGDGAANVLEGRAGNDTIDGGGGDDELIGGAGADMMIGGDGDDTYIVDNAGDVTSETSALGGTDTVQSSVTRTLNANIENLILTGVAAINGFGNVLNNTITGK